MESNELSKEEIVKILTSYGFACSVEESIHDLCEALNMGLDDGTIPGYVLDQDYLKFL